MSTRAEVPAGVVSVDLRDWMDRHIRVYRDERGIEGGSDWAWTMLRPDGYEMHFGPPFWAASPAIQTRVVLHEVAHILRGDFFAKAENMQKLRVCEDAVINRYTMTEALCAQYHWVSYARTCELAGLAAAQNHSAMMLYQHIPDEPKNESPCVLILDGTEEGCMLPHLKAAAVLRGLPSMQAMLKPLPRTYSNPERIGLSPLDTLLRRTLDHIRIRARGGSPTRERGWRRERVPGLRAWHTATKASVMIGIDISGSRAHDHTFALGLAKAARREYAATVVGWDTDVYPWPTKQGGGGTMVGPLLDTAAARRPDVLVISTDGDISDLNEPGASLCPIIWILRQGERAIPRRRQDIILLMPEEGHA